MSLESGDRSPEQEQEQEKVEEYEIGETPAPQ